LKNASRLIVLFAGVTSSLWAAQKGSVTIPQGVSVGSTHLTPGQYKVSFDGAGPNVKVTLTRSGSASIMLDAKLQPGERGAPSSVTLVTRNGTKVLKEIDINGEILVFEEADGETH